MDIQHIIVYITTPDRGTGETIAGALIERKLAACVNLTPVHSIYRWEGQVAREDETLLIIKTRADLFETQLLAAVRELHPYEVPEIIALPVVLGAPGYLKWIDEETGAGS
jgi:periplasmic divalent cation tolerance protein